MSNVVVSNYDEQRVHSLSRATDLLDLTKPRIGVMVLVTVVVSAYIGSWGNPPLWVLVHTVVGTALIAASASAFNQLMETRSDALMPRTADRPLPAGRLSTQEVWLFGAVSVAVGVVYLVLTVNLTTALLGVLTWFLYVAIYTPLKAITPANTGIGAVAGALPIVMGWTAVEAPMAFYGIGLDGGIKLAALFLILYLWQFPHFMAIAWIYRQQYSAAGLQMLTVVDPSGRRAGQQAVCGALALIPVSLLAAVGPLSADKPHGLLCVAGTLLLSFAYLAASVVFCLYRTNRAARGLLWTSLVYLPLQLALLCYCL